LEDDLLQLSRWIEFSADNETVYSIELARLLMTAAAEVDVVAKALCKAIDRERNASSINVYQSVLLQAVPMLPQAQVEMPRFGMLFQPWSNWAEPTTPPDWWQGNNKVKHHRAEHFRQANLKNVLNAIAALLVLLLQRWLGLLGQVLGLLKWIPCGLRLSTVLLAEGPSRP
jgi:hypothetical protein